MDDLRTVKPEVPLLLEVARLFRVLFTTFFAVLTGGGGGAGAGIGSGILGALGADMHITLFFLWV